MTFTYAELHHTLIGRTISFLKRVEVVNLTMHFFLYSISFSAFLGSAICAFFPSFVGLVSFLPPHFVYCPPFEKTQIADFVQQPKYTKQKHQIGLLRRVNANEEA